MSTTYYHAGPKGLTELRPAKDLINDGDLSLKDFMAMWTAKWGEDISEDSAIDYLSYDGSGISFTTEMEEAQSIAKSIGGTVYSFADIEVETGSEGYPIVYGTVECRAAA